MSVLGTGEFVLSEMVSFGGTNGRNCDSRGRGSHLALWHRSVLVQFTNLKNGKMP